jgi:hypothetical protein
VDDAGVVDAITDAARRQSALCARELAAIGELYARRAPEDDDDRINWAIDGHENDVAEVDAALGVSRCWPKVLAGILLPATRIRVYVW